MENEQLFAETIYKLKRFAYSNKKTYVTFSTRNAINNILELYKTESADILLPKIPEMLKGCIETKPQQISKKIQNKFGK